LLKLPKCLPKRFVNCLLEVGDSFRYNGKIRQANFRDADRLYRLSPQLLLGKYGLQCLVKRVASINNWLNGFPYGLLQVVSWDQLISKPVQAFVPLAKVGVKS
jgi:hypothetical protein